MCVYQCICARGQTKVTDEMNLSGAVKVMGDSLNPPRRGVKYTRGQLMLHLTTGDFCLTSNLKTINITYASDGAARCEGLFTEGQFFTGINKFHSRFDCTIFSRCSSFGLHFRLLIAVNDKWCLSYGVF